MKEKQVASSEMKVRQKVRLEADYGGPEVPTQKAHTSLGE